jgi:hypothetical protein
MRRRRAAGILFALAASSVERGGARAEENDQHQDRQPDSARYTLRAELGAEYDSNAHRTELVIGAVNPDLVRSALARGVLSGTLGDVVAGGQDVAMSATVAGKLFAAPAARDEDVVVGESTLTWRAALGPRATLALSGAYYEAFQRPQTDPSAVSERRDFRSLTPALRAGYAPGAQWDLGVTAAYRWFVFKPDRDFDFQAPIAAVDLRWARESADGSADWEVRSGAAFERRALAGPRLVNACTPPSAIGHDCLPSPTSDRRLDHFLTSHIEIARTGRMLLGAGYAFHLNRSNSFGESVQRHFVTARFGAALPFQLFVAALAEILFASYSEQVIVGGVSTAGATFVNIEDENRSNLRVDLSRNLSERLQLIARYTYYTSPFGLAGLSYSRHTALLSLAFTFER